MPQHHVNIYCQVADCLLPYLGQISHVQVLVAVQTSYAQQAFVVLVHLFITVYSTAVESSIQSNPTVPGILGLAAGISSSNQSIGIKCCVYRITCTWCTLQYGMVQNANSCKTQEETCEVIMTSPARHPLIVCPTRHRTPSSAAPKLKAWPSSRRCRA